MIQLAEGIELGKPAKVLKNCYVTIVYANGFKVDEHIDVYDDISKTPYFELSKKSFEILKKHFKDSDTIKSIKATVVNVSTSAFYPVIV